MKGKGYIVFALAEIIAAAVWLTLTPGVYVPSINMIVCVGRRPCLHEQAHLMDDGNGQVSQSISYMRAVEMYRFRNDICETCRDRYYEFTRDFPGLGVNPLRHIDNPFTASALKGWGDYSEYYADLWAEAGGDIHEIPDLLRPFYLDFQTIGLRSAARQ